MRSWRCLLGHRWKTMDRLTIGGIGSLSQVCLRCWRSRVIDVKR